MSSPCVARIIAVFRPPRARPARALCGSGGACSIACARCGVGIGGGGGGRLHRASRGSHTTRVKRIHTHVIAVFRSPLARPERARRGGGGARSIASTRCGVGGGGGGRLHHAPRTPRVTRTRAHVIKAHRIKNGRASTGAPSSSSSTSTSRVATRRRREPTRRRFELTALPTERRSPRSASKGNTPARAHARPHARTQGGCPPPGPFCGDLALPLAHARRRSLACSLSRTRGCGARGDGGGGGGGGGGGD